MPTRQRSLAGLSSECLCVAMALRVFDRHAPHAAALRAAGIDPVPTADRLDALQERANSGLRDRSATDVERTFAADDRAALLERYIDAAPTWRKRLALDPEPADAVARAWWKQAQTTLRVTARTTRGALRQAEAVVDALGKAGPMPPLSVEIPAQAAAFVTELRAVQAASEAANVARRVTGQEALRLELLDVLADLRRRWLIAEGLEPLLVPYSATLEDEPAVLTEAPEARQRRLRR